MVVATWSVRAQRSTSSSASAGVRQPSVFASLECDMIDLCSFKTKTEARLAVFTSIEAWYNTRRRVGAEIAI